MNIRELVRKHGDNSNSFLALYDGFQYFTLGDSAIPYLDRKTIRIGACDPLAPTEERAAVLKAFSIEARRLGKTAVILPVSAETAALARDAGYSSIMIGSEPYFDLPSYPPTGKTWETLVGTAKIFQSKGARVQEFDPDGLAPSERASFEAIVEEWFSTRKMDALGFLNQVKPWDHAADKKYFALEHAGEKIAFIASIPIWPTSGWYLIDVMRRDHPPAGSTELLIIESMRLLKEKGAREISLGVAPLSGLESAPSADGHARMYRFLRFLYAKGGSFYNFESLHQFKLKFLPSRIKPVFAVYSGPLGIRQFMDISDVFLPGGVGRAIVSGTVRAYSQFKLGQWVRSQLGSDIVALSTPSSGRKLLRRFRLTTLLLVLDLIAIRAGLGAPWSVPLIAAGVGCVEYLGGLAAALSGFFFPILVLGALAFKFPAVLPLPSFWPSFGALGALGAASLFLKQRKSVSLTLILLGLACAAFTRDLHFAMAASAYALGIVGLRAYFKIRSFF